MIEKLRENAITALTAAAVCCDGKCGRDEQVCYKETPVSVTAMRSDGPMAIDGDVDVIVDIVLAAIGLTCADDGTHLYLATSCLHNEHEYCQSNTGHAGSKRAAECKFCGAPCVCACHLMKAPTS